MGKRLLTAAGVVLAVGIMFGLTYVKGEDRAIGGWPSVIMFAVFLAGLTTYYSLKHAREQRTAARGERAGRTFVSEE